MYVHLPLALGRPALCCRTPIRPAWDVGPPEWQIFRLAAPNHCCYLSLSACALFAQFPNCCYMSEDMGVGSGRLLHCNDPYYVDYNLPLSASSVNKRKNIYSHKLYKQTQSACKKVSICRGNIN